MERSVWLIDHQHGERRKVLGLTFLVHLSDALGKVLGLTVLVRVDAALTHAV